MIADSADRHRLLIADDNQLVLDLLVELLVAEGYEVASAPDGGGVFDLALSFEPDLIISDVVMPVIDGISLCRQLKQDARTRSIPVLLISGVRREDAHGLEGLVAGADDYLEVPFRNEALLVKVARLTERHRVVKHYWGIVENANDIIYTRNMDGYLTSINAAGARFFGRAATDLVGTHLSEFVGVEAAERDIHETRTMTSEALPRSIYQLRDAEGRLRYLEGSISVERNRTGKSLAVKGVVRDITEQKLAEESLRESEESYRRLVELSPQAIVVSCDGNFLYVNGAALRLWGASSEEELVGRSIFDVVHPDYRDSVKERVRKIQHDGIPAPLAEQKFVRLDGEVIDVEVVGIPFTFKGKAAVQAVIRNITENRKAEQALRENEERYRELFENANDIIYTHDLAGNFTSLNRSGEQIIGYTREEAVRMNVAEVIAPEYLATAREMMARKATSQTPTVYELDVITKDGRRVRLEVSTRLIYRHSKAVGIQGIARDLTERKRSEEALRESQAYFHSFMDNSPTVAFMKDEAGRYVYVNRPFEQFFGKDLAFLKGKTSFDWLPADLAKKTHDHDLGVLTSGVAQEIIEIVPTEDGALHHWLVFKFPITDASGRRFVGGVGVDITEHSQAEKALAQQAEREAMTRRISQAVRCSLDSAEIFQTAVRELGSYLNVDRCSLFMRDQKGQHAINAAEYHVEGIEPAGTDFALADVRVLIQTLSEQGFLASDDAANDERITDLYKRILKEADVRSIMYVAIRVGDEVPAAFALSTTREARHWTEADVTLAKAVADQTGIAIRQAQLYQKAEATSAREALVNRLTMAIRASLSLPEVLSTATRELGRALSASRVHLHLYNSEDPISPVEYEYVAPGCSSVSHFGVSYDDPIGKHLLNTSKPLVIDDALNYNEGASEFSAYVRAQALKVNLRSQIDYPLIVKGLFRGVLCINQTDRMRHWTDDELAFVEAVAARLAIGIAQAELFEMVARGKTEWETTFDAMSDGIFIFDRAGVLKRVNRAGAALEHAQPRALLGRKCCEILRSSAEAETCAVEKAIADAQSITVEVTPERLNRPLLVTVEPVVDGGKALAAVCTARDLSELRTVQAVAREHQSLLTNILESARESIYAVDTDGRFKWCNSATLAGLGYERENLIGCHLLEMVYEDDRDLVQEKFLAALAGRPQTYEMRYIDYSGMLCYARVDNSPLVVDGETTGVLGIARDITVQKEERERVARADKLRALGQLASGVAHDFNNSLAAILGRAQLLRRQTEDEALVRNLEIIQTAAEDAAATVRRIQTFARKSTAKEFELLNVNSLLNDAIEITRTRWQNDALLRGLEYQVTFSASGDHFAYASASELREVFVNLIVNAVDAMPQGGRLEIGCERKGNRLYLTFADNGSGMPEDVRQKIFEPFFTTKGAQGTGLGLSVSYSIIERHEGSISVTSQINGGTTFSIDLPAVEEIVSQPEVEQDLESMPSFSALVIDDEEFVRETMADMLTVLGHRVDLAVSGQDALSKVETADYDLVFTDLAMPEMDGWETAREIRRRRPGIVIVLVTGYGTGTVPPSGETGLVDAVIGKPFDFNQVSQIICQLMDEKTELQNVVA